MKTTWANVKPGDRVLNQPGEQGDLVTGLHAIQEGVDGFQLSIRKNMKNSIVVSGDHLIKVRVPAVGKNGLEKGKNYNIPEQLGIILSSTTTYKSCNYHISSDEIMTEEELMQRIQVGPALENVEVEYLEEEEPPAPGLFWVPAWAIHHFSKLGIKFESDLGKRIHSSYYGLIDARCITTESGEYRVSDLVSHNSVAIQNIFFHTIQHGEDIKIAGIDLKLTEFTPWKGHKHVMGIANDIPTALEILRIGREIMYKRNAQLAEIDLKNFTDFKPKHRDGYEYISGMRLKSRDMLKVEINGEITEMPAAEVVDLILQGDD